MARFISVTENDLFLFLSPLSTPLSTFSEPPSWATANVSAGSSSSQSMEGVVTSTGIDTGPSSPQGMEGVAATSTGIDAGPSSSQDMDGVVATSPDADDQEALNNVLDQIFPINKRTNKMRSDYVKSKKGWLITQLLYDRGDSKAIVGNNFRRADGYGHKILIAGERDPGNKKPYQLRTEFKTNGLVLQLVATDTRHPKRKAKSKYRHHDEEDEDEDENVLEQEEPIEEIRDENEKFKNRIEREDKQYAADPDVEDAYTYKHKRRSEVTDLDANERRDNHIVLTRSGFECDLAGRSELLANASQLTFSPSLKKVIGVDLGEIVSAAVCVLDKRHPNARHSKKVKRTFLYEPIWRFSRLLRSHKKSNFIDVLESRTPSRKHGGVIEYLKYKARPAEGVLQEHFASEQQSLDEISKPEMAGILAGSVEEVIFRFYHSKWMLKKRWDTQKAATQALHLAIEAILSLAGDVDEQRLESRVVFAIGLAVFNSGVGPSSKHLVLLRKLVQKVRSLSALAYRLPNPNEIIYLSYPLL